MSKIKKIVYVIIRTIIKPVDKFSPRKYMKMYNWYLKKIGIKLTGTPRYISPSVDFDGTGYNRTFIGDNVVISKNVLFLNHDYSITCGLRAIGADVDKEAYWLKDIVIGNNVFIGANSVIMPGTTIGDNAIVGAASVVKGKIASGSIVAGNPAKKIADIDEWANKKLAEASFLREE